jgi:type VI secretion system protein ImpE
MAHSLQDYIAAADVEGATEFVRERIRKSPMDLDERWMLLDLAILRGDLSDADQQLEVLREIDPASAIEQAALRRVLSAERERQKVLQGEALPSFLGEPPAWAGQLAQALQWEGQGHLAEAADLRGRALEEAPARPGSWNGSPFAWIADADTRWGPILEVFLESGYRWVPLGAVREIRAQPPQILRDLCWYPVQLTWENLGAAEALVPARYASVAPETDGSFLLGRQTVWRETAVGEFRGRGLRLFATEEGEWPLFELAELRIAHGDPP